MARSKVAEPKEASVASICVVPGIGAVPNRTAVPAGVVWASVVPTTPSETVKTDMKPGKAPEGPIGFP